MPRSAGRCSPTTPRSFGSGAFSFGCARDLRGWRVGRSAMSRKQISWIAAAALGFAAWHFGLGAQVSAVWKTIGSGTRAMTGETAIDVGQDAKRSLVQSNLERAMREYRATV